MRSSKMSIDEVRFIDWETGHFIPMHFHTHAQCYSYFCFVYSFFFFYYPLLSLLHLCILGLGCGIRVGYSQIRGILDYTKTGMTRYVYESAESI